MLYFLQSRKWHQFLHQWITQIHTSGNVSKYNSESGTKNQPKTSTKSKPVSGIFILFFFHFLSQIPLFLILKAIKGVI